VRRPPDGHAGVGRPEVDADRRPGALGARHLRAAEAAAGKGRRSTRPNLRSDLSYVERASATVMRVCTWLLW
jgi:hypothetical protein